MEGGREGAGWSGNHLQHACEVDITFYSRFSLVSILIHLIFFFFPALNHSGVWCSPKRGKKKKKWEWKPADPGSHFHTRRYNMNIVCVCPTVCVCVCVRQRLGQMWWTDVRLTGHRCSVKNNMSGNMCRGRIRIILLWYTYVCIGLLHLRNTATTMCLCVPVLCTSAYICYIQPETYCVRRVSLVFDAADLFIHKKKKQKNKKYIKPGHTPAVITAARLLSCSTTTNQCRAILFGNKLSLFFHLSSSLFPTSHRKLTLKEWLFIVLLAEVVVWLCGRSRLKRVAASVLHKNSDFQ